MDTNIRKTTSKMRLSIFVVVSVVTVFCYAGNLNSQQEENQKESWLMGVQIMRGSAEKQLQLDRFTFIGNCALEQAKVTSVDVRGHLSLSRVDVKEDSKVRGNLFIEKSCFPSVDVIGAVEMYSSTGSHIAVVGYLKVMEGSNLKSATVTGKKVKVNGSTVEVVTVKNDKKTLIGKLGTPVVVIRNNGSVGKVIFEGVTGRVEVDVSSRVTAVENGTLTTPPKNLWDRFCRFFS